MRRGCVLSPLVSLIAITGFPASGTAQNLPETPGLRYHLTARPWEPTGIEAEDAWDAVERLVRFSLQHQDDRGAFVDPILEREFQYATPYLAYAIAALLDAGRGDDLLIDGVRAMNHATGLVAEGNASIPDQHGEFFIAPLADAITMFEPHVDGVLRDAWRKRLTTAIDSIIENRQAKTNNWRTYAMKGEWVRFRAGLVEHADAVAFIEDGWLRRTQRERMLGTKGALYQDWNGDPQSHAVEAVGRGNLLAVALSGYDGQSAHEIREATTEATKFSLLLQDPTGQCPPNGRTDDHVFNDVLYALCFAGMAQHAAERRNPDIASVYRRAAALGLTSVDRWWREDEPWDGSLSITKNFFDPRDRVGYQPASQYSNYTGAAMYHLAELARALELRLPELPAPAEIGGYAVATDAAFGSGFLNAGGMQVVFNLRGDSVPKYGKYWTPLGIVRLSRSGWSSSVGLYDGEHDARANRGVTLAPTWKERRGWTRLAERPRDYRGVFTAQTVHPLIVRGRMLYAPVTGVGGPTFSMDLTVIPDGVLIRVTSANLGEFGLTLPVTIDDGQTKAGVDLNRRALQAKADSGEQSIVYTLVQGDRIEDGGEAVQGTYGWLKPYRARSENGIVSVFVRLADGGESSGSAAIHLTPSGFESPIATVSGDTYRGAHAAGGFTDFIDIDGDGSRELALDRVVGIVAQIRDGRIAAIETDRDASMMIDGETRVVRALSPIVLPR